MSGKPANKEFKFKPPPPPKPLPSARKPLGDLSSPRKPLGDLSSPRKPLGDLSSTRKPLGDLSSTRKPLQQVDDDSWRAELRPDPFVKSELVYELKDSTLKQFLNEKDVALVLFYDPCDSLSRWCRPRFAKAAEITMRENHAYAAVNCVDNQGLCDSQKIFSYPTYGLYSRGRVIGTITEISDFTSENMKNFVQKTPVLEDTYVTTAPCKQDNA